MYLFNAGYNGTHPAVDDNGKSWKAESASALRAGQPLCDGKYFLVFMNGAGDLEYLSNDLKFPHHASLHPCWLCAASRAAGTDAPITDCRVGAVWKERLVPHAVGAAVHPSEHPIFTLTGCTRFCFHGDLQHTYHLGVDGYFVGSVFSDIIENHGWPGSAEAKTEQLWDLVRLQYGKFDSPTRIACLRHAMFKQPGRWASMRGHAMEIYQLLCCLPFVLEVLFDGSPYHQARLQACRHLLRIHAIFSDGGVFLGDAAAAEALTCADQFLLLNNLLLNVAVERHQLHYGLVTKHHLMWHIADLSKFQNPKFTACFEFEDFMGKVKKCAQASMAGSSLPLIGSKVLECVLLAFHLRLQSPVDQRSAFMSLQNTAALPTLSPTTHFG